MDEKLTKKVKEAVGGAVEEAARESRGREIPVEKVEVSVKVKGPRGREVSRTVEVVPDPPPKK